MKVRLFWIIGINYRDWYSIERKDHGRYEVSRTGQNDNEIYITDKAGAEKLENQATYKIN